MIVNINTTLLLKWQALSPNLHDVQIKEKFEDWFLPTFMYDTAM